MSQHRAAFALSLTAIAVAVLGQTPLGNAAASAVRVALFAQNSARVNNIQASRKPVPGRLLALDATARFPASVLRPPAGTEYTRTIVVHPDPDATKAGSELLRAVHEITDSSATNPYLVKIEPGVYDLGARSLEMKPYVDVEGSGELVTTITSSIVTGAGTVVGTDNSELRFVTVKNTGGGQQSVALYADRTSPRFTHVAAISSGSTENYGIHVSNGSPALTHVSSTATGGNSAIALANFGAGTTVRRSSFAASGGAFLSAAFLSSFGANTTLSDSSFSASGGAFAVGVRTYNGTHTLANVTATATGATESYGLYSGWRVAAPAVSVSHSRLSGSTNSVFAIGGTVRVGASQLAGPVGTELIGAVRCAVSYDGGFNALGPTCAPPNVKPS